MASERPGGSYGSTPRAATIATLKKIPLALKSHFDVLGSYGLRSRHGLLTPDGITVYGLGRWKSSTVGLARGKVALKVRKL